MTPLAWLLLLALALALLLLADQRYQHRHDRRVYQRRLTSAELARDSARADAARLRRLLEQALREDVKH